MAYAHDPISTERRRSNRARRLGPNAACALCGETNPDALSLQRRSVLEVHHVAGRANDEELTVVVCLNHHGRLSAAQHDAGVFRDPTAGSVLGRVINAIRSLATFAELLPDFLHRVASVLEQLVELLDASLPQWRTLPLVGDL
jgi:hypothetical protein